MRVPSVMLPTYVKPWIVPLDLQYRYMVNCVLLSYIWSTYYS